MHPIFFVTIKITYPKMLVVVVFPNFKLGDIFAKYVITGTQNSSMFVKS